MDCGDQHPEFKFQQLRGCALFGKLLIYPGFIICEIHMGVHPSQNCLKSKQDGMCVRYKEISLSDISPRTPTNMHLNITDALLIWVSENIHTTATVLEHNSLFFYASWSSSSIRSDILQVAQLPSLIKKNSRQLLIADRLLSIGLSIWLKDLRLLSDPANHT